jgi:G3E family GTPase
VSSADLLILNKIDLIPSESESAIEALLRSLEPEAPIVRSVLGQVPVELLFPPSLEVTDRTGPAPAPPAHTHDHFETEEWQPQPGQSEADLEAWLTARPLLRAKGFVETDQGLRLLQLVGRRIEWSAPENEPPPELRNRVIVIAHGRDC